MPQNLNAMKCKIFILTFLLIAGCSKQKGEIDLNDIDEQVIEEFYDNVLDTIIDNDILNNVPIANPELLNYLSDIAGLTGEDISFIKQQISKFDSLRWKNLVSREKIITEEEYETLFGTTHNWTLFHQKYGYQSICSISIPLFTKNGKRVFIEHSVQCGGLCGEGELIEWEVNGDKRIFKKRTTIWIAK